MNEARRTLSQEALAELKKYDFPGNVRELQSILERACIESSSEITPDAVRLAIGKGGVSAYKFASNDISVYPDGFIINAKFPWRNENVRKLLDTIEISTALGLEGGNVRAAARKLQMCRTTLVDRIVNKLGRCWCRRRISENR